MNRDELLARNPFPGLRAYSPLEAELFFGRREQIAELLQRVGSEPFVAVAGASGCGKSSLVLAGLLNALDERATTVGLPAWRRVIMRPGRQPILNLAEQLAGALGLDRSPEAVAALDGQLRLSAVGLADAVRRAALPADVRVLIVVDQFEELFRYERMSDLDEAAAFVKLLLHAVTDPLARVRVVITLRSDALGSCADFSGLAQAVSHGQVLVPKLTRDQRKEAIVGPVNRRGYKIAPSLVQRILNDVPDDFDDLPVMQHALARTWAHWADVAGGERDIKVEDYEDIGTSRGAIDKHAGEVLRGLTVHQRDRVVPTVMRALTERLADGSEVRRPLSFDELCEVARAERADIAQVVDALRRDDTSFLRPPTTEPLSANPVIDITHESLIRQWSAVRGWVNAEADARTGLEVILEAAQRYAQGDGDLLQGRSLERAFKWKRIEQPNDAWVRLCVGDARAAMWPQALKFLDESDKEARSARCWRNVVRLSVGALAVALFAVLLYAGYTQYSARESDNQKRSHELASLGWLELRLDPALAAHLAVAALDWYGDNPQAERLLRQAVETLKVAHVEHVFDLGVPVVDARPNHEGTLIAVVGESQLPILYSRDWTKPPSPRELPWAAAKVWLLDNRGLVVIQSVDQGVHVHKSDGTPLADWNCSGDKVGDHVYQVQVSHDGRWLAAGCRFGALALWALPATARPTGEPTLLTTGFDATVTALAFSQDGQWLASGDADGVVLLWKVAEPSSPWLGQITPHRLESPIEHSGRASNAIQDIDMLASESGFYLATASDDGDAIVWKIDLDRRSLATPAGDVEKVKRTLRHGRPVVRARFDRNEQLMTIADKRLQFWKDGDPVPSNTHHNSWITDASVSPNGELAVTASDDGVARVWARGRDAVATLRGHRDALSATRFISEERIITSSHDGTMRVWKIDPVSTLCASPGRWMLSAAPSPDGRELAICGERSQSGADASCRVLPLVDNKRFNVVEDCLQQDEHHLPAPSDRNGFEARVDMIVRALWDSTGEQILATRSNYDIFRRTTPLRWERDSRELVTDRSDFLPYAVNARRSEILLVNGEGQFVVHPETSGNVTPESTRQSGLQYYPQAAALSVDGRSIAFADDKSIILHDRGAPDATERRLSGHQGAVMALAFSADGRSLASAGADRTARVWKLGAPAAEIEPVDMTGGHAGTIYTVAFNHRGDRIVTGSADGTLRVWDVRNGRELAALDWHADAVNDVRFHPTEEVIFTASDDGTVKKGICRTCDMSIEELRHVVLSVDKGLARLTEGDNAYVERARIEGGKAKRCGTTC